MREFRRKRRNAQFKGYLERLARVETADQLQCVTQAMLAALGGIDRFALALRKLWDETGRTRDGLRLRTSAALAMIRLLEGSEAASRSKSVRRRYQYFSDEELERERRCMMAGISSRPALKTRPAEKSSGGT
jgi:hypothetical protein